MRAFLLAIPLMTCRTGVHVPEGGGKPVRQQFVRAEKQDPRGEPEAAQAPAPEPAEPSPAAEPLPPKRPPPEPPPRVAKRPPVAEPPLRRADPPPVRRRPPKLAERPAPPARPSRDLCGEISPELADPKPMSDEERRPWVDIVGRNIGEIRACYEEARVRAHVDGCMFAVVTVDSLGQLREPYIDASNIEDPQMQRCITTAIGAMDLRAPVDDLVWFVLYPFFFEDGEIFHSSQHLRAG